MKIRLDKGSIPGGLLVAGVLFSLVSIFSLIMIPVSIGPTADMRLEPVHGAALVGETFVLTVVVESSVPVNVFAGELHFNTEVLEVAAIDYNTSVADLWAELPWYSNGAGTLNFGGGTTRPGGFVGTAPLIEVTFKTKSEGNGMITLNNPRILLHDGLGTDAVLEKPIDAIFFVDNAEVDTPNIISRSSAGVDYQVVSKAPSTDLNGDGKVSIADVSIFMLNMSSDDMKFDFNQDGKVSIKDLSLLMQQL